MMAIMTDRRPMNSKSPTLSFLSQLRWKSEKIQLLFCLLMRFIFSVTLTSETEEMEKLLLDGELQFALFKMT